MKQLTEYDATTTPDAQPRNKYDNDNFRFDDDDKTSFK